MTSTVALRDPSIVREELQDLVGYLSGVPEEVRHSEALVAYELRVAELSRELILSETFQFTQNKLVGRSEHGEFRVAEYKKMQESLSRLASQYEHGAHLRLNASRFFYWSVLHASGGTMASAVSGVGLVLPLSVVATFLAVIPSLFRLADQARERQLMADHIVALREEIAHSFGPAGEVLTPSEYYPASTKRIEHLIAELKQFQLK